MLFLLLRLVPERLQVFGSTCSNDQEICWAHLAVEVTQLSSYGVRSQYSCKCFEVIDNELSALPAVGVGQGTLVLCPRVL